MMGNIRKKQQNLAQNNHQTLHYKQTI